MVVREQSVGDSTSRSGRVWGLLIGSVLIASACTGADSDPADQQLSQVKQNLDVQRTVTILLPRRLFPGAVLLAANQELLVNDRVNVVAGGMTTIVNMGTAQTNLGVDSRTGDVWSVAPLVLRDRATVAGTAFVSSTVTAAPSAVLANPVQNRDIVSSQDGIEWTVTIPTSTGDASLEPGQTRTLVPGSYGNASIKSSATLTLAPGIFFLRTLTLEPGAKLSVSGKTVVYVTDGFTHRGTILGNDVSPGRLMVVYLGANFAPVESQFVGTIVAPNAKVSLASIALPYQGAFLAKAIEVHQGARVEHRPFMGWDDFRSPDDSVSGGGPGTIPIPNTPVGVLLRNHLTKVMGAGPQAEAEYQSSLSALRAQASEVIPLVTSIYDGLPASQYSERWLMAQVLAAIGTSGGLDPLLRVGLTAVPTTPGDPLEEESLDPVGEEFTIRARAVDGVARLALMGNAAAVQGLRRVVVEGRGLTRLYAVRGYLKLGPNARNELLAILPAADRWMLDLEDRVEHAVQPIGAATLEDPPGTSPRREDPDGTGGSPPNGHDAAPSNATGGTGTGGAAGSGGEPR